MKYKELIYEYCEIGYILTFIATMCLSAVFINLHILGELDIYSDKLISNVYSSIYLLATFFFLVELYDFINLKGEVKE